MIPAPLRRLHITPAHVVDLFVYTVVLNLAAEYLPSVIAESFSMSLLTAALLKLALEGVLWVKVRVKRRFRSAGSAVGKVFWAVSLWLVLVGSKFVMLELIAWASGGAVQLGGFFAVTGLILALMAARVAVRRLLEPTDGTADPAER